MPSDILGLLMDDLFSAVASFCLLVGDGHNLENMPKTTMVRMRILHQKNQHSHCDFKQKANQGHRER
jgi:hypothetical protein